MKKNPCILVVKMREIIYTMLLFFLFIVLILCTIIMFSSKKEKKKAQYRPGIYSTPITLSGLEMDMEVTVDSNHINSIHLINRTESVVAAYSDLSPVISQLTSQILEKQSLDSITCTYEDQYSSHSVFNAVKASLELAKA